jgi:hypothetical protein
LREDDGGVAAAGGVKEATPLGISPARCMLVDQTRREKIWERAGMMKSSLGLFPTSMCGRARLATVEVVERWRHSMRTDLLSSLSYRNECS